MVCEPSTGTTYTHPLNLRFCTLWIHRILKGPKGKKEVSSSDQNSCGCILCLPQIQGKSYHWYRKCNVKEYSPVKILLWSPQPSADPINENRRLAFFVAVLRGSLAIWPEYWMNSFDFFFCLSFSTHTHTHLTFFHGHPLGLKMESKRKWNASQWESWHHVPAVSINMCRWTMGSGSKWLSDQTELKQI